MIHPEEAIRWTQAGREIAWKPRTGRPVLMATDFGWGDSRDLNEPVTAYDWQRLARGLRQKRCPLISLIPVPPGNWPRWLDQRFTPIHWDPRTRAETIRSLIGPGHVIDR